MKFQVKVTQENIDRGERESSTLCALSLAFRDLPGVSSVDVGSNEAEAMLWMNNGTEYKAILPNDAYEFYQAFDEGKEVQPFEFEVDAEVTGPEPDEDYFEEDRPGGNEILEGDL